MYFSYLNLPALPDDFKEKCYGNIKYIGVDPRLAKTNSERGIMNKATFLPIVVNDWLKENIIIPIFGSIRPEQRQNLLNVTSYAANPTGNSRLDGSHTQHVDRERNYALNYYFDAGGENTSIKWYSDFTKNGGEEIAVCNNLQINRWCLLYVNPIVHAVRNIEPGRSRVFISIAFDAGDLSTFNSRDFFKNIIVESSLI
jgi:hypothetical protein